MFAIRGSGNLLGVKTEDDRRVACGAIMRRGSTASYIGFHEETGQREVDLTIRDNPTT